MDVVVIGFSVVNFSARHECYKGVVLLKKTHGHTDRQTGTLCTGAGSSSLHHHHNHHHQKHQRHHDTRNIITTANITTNTTTTTPPFSDGSKTGLLTLYLRPYRPHRQSKLLGAPEWSETRPVSNSEYCPLASMQYYLGVQSK